MQQDTEPQLRHKPPREPERAVPPSVPATAGEGQAAPVSGQGGRLLFWACTMNLGKASKQHLARVFRPYVGVTRGMHVSPEPRLGRNRSTQTLEESQPGCVAHGAFYIQETENSGHLA